MKARSGEKEDGGKKKGMSRREGWREEKKREQAC